MAADDKAENYGRQEATFRCGKQSRTVRNVTGGYGVHLKLAWKIQQNKNIVVTHLKR